MRAARRIVLLVVRAASSVGRTTPPHSVEANLAHVASGNVRAAVRSSEPPATGTKALRLDDAATRRP